MLYEALNYRLTYFDNSNELANALRAVVELHKPLEGTITCHQLCEINGDKLYECDTIQAIEKELS